MTFGFNNTAEEVTAGRDLTGQTWLITGSNSGLGLESARVMALRGAHIIAAARTQTKAENMLHTLDISGTAVACELSNLDSVRTAVKTIRELGKPLNGILANAGIMALPTLKQKEGIELQFYTNHVGHFALVNGLVDILSQNGRVVMLSSGAHYFAMDSGLELDNLSGEKDYDAWRMYGRSKLANILYANALNKRFEGTKRTANSVHPGVIKTNLARHIENPKAMYDSLKDRLTLKTVEQGAATQCYVATNPELEGIGGKYFSDSQITSPAAVAQSDEMAEALWEVTERLIHE
jgi:NAD(P)-dependent dehydrogenase (short-subunit alcohol dehydrogenase family)